MDEKGGIPPTFTDMNQQPPPQGFAQPPPPGYTQPVGYPEQNLGGGVAPPPAPPGYDRNVPGQVGQQTVIITQPGPVNRQYGPSPVTMDCPYCFQTITSGTSKNCSGMSWLICGIICLAGLIIPFLWLGCCLIPFCIPSLYDTQHTCPNCKRTLGIHKSGNL